MIADMMINGKVRKRDLDIKEKNFYHQIEIKAEESIFIEVRSSETINKVK